MDRPIPSRVKEQVNREDYHFPRSLPSTMPMPIVNKHELYDIQSTKQQSKIRNKGMYPVRPPSGRLSNNRPPQAPPQLGTPSFDNQHTQNNQQQQPNMGYQDRNIFKKPVQNFKFKENNLNYRLQNFVSLNNCFDNSEINKFYDSKPIDTRRDHYEETRNSDEEKFLELQGGPMCNIMDNKGTTTRSKKQIVNNYMPIGRNLAVPPSAI